MCRNLGYGRMQTSEVVENMMVGEAEDVTWMVEADGLGKQGAPVEGE